MLLSMILHEPTAYLMEYSAELEKRYPGVQLTVPHLSKILKDKDINRKKVYTLLSWLILVG